jgi:dTDP-glucose pyrophosphorylase
VNRKGVELESAFWFYADVLTATDLNTMLRFHGHGSAATPGVYTAPDRKRCGIIRLDWENTVIEFVKKPVQPSSNLAFPES